MTFKSVISRLFAQSEFKFKKDFAKKVGISKQNMFNYLNGNTEPSFSEACRIINASGTKELAIIENFKSNNKQK